MPLTGLRAAGAQGRRETCQLAGVLPPLGNGPRGSRKGQCPLIPDCALCAQGRMGICQLAGVLPPLGNRPRGSRKGQCPLILDCALCAQGRRGICQLAGVLPPLGNRPRGSPVWSSFVLVDKERPPFGGGPHGSLKGQRMKENTLPFCVAGISKTHRSVPSSAVYVWIVPTAEEKTRLFSARRNYPSCNVTSQLALVEPVSRQLWGEQSGDRQRREKGPSILTAEIGEHERAPRDGGSCLTPLRATL